MINRVVTLDIDSNFIRLLEVKEGKVQKWASAPLDVAVPGGEAASSYKALGLKIKQLMNSSGIKANKVITSVSGLYSVSRMLTVPSRPGGQNIHDAILEVANETMPLRGDRLYFLWQTIASGDDTRKILAVGVPRETVDTDARALKAVGINPYIMEPKAIALARAVNREKALILNIESSSFDIIIIVNGVPEVMHTIALQENDLTAEEKLERAAMNLEMTVDFYNSRDINSFNLDSATPLFITGYMSGDGSFMEKLRARLSYSVEPLAPALQCPDQMPVSLFATNIGLAMRETASSRESTSDGFPPISINLLPAEYHPWRPSLKQLYTVVGIILSLSLLYPLFQITQEAMDTSAKFKSEYTVLSNELQRRQMEIKKREPLQQAVTGYNAIIDRGGNFTEDLLVINREAERLGINIESIKHTGGVIKVICNADEGDYVAFRDYKTALENSGRFATPIPPPEGYPYTWRGTIQLEPIAGES